MFATKPEMAKRWAAETDQKALPEKVSKVAKALMGKSGRGRKID